MSFGRVVDFWNWYWILKLLSYFEMFMYFFVCYWIEKKNRLLCDIFIEITQSWRCLEIDFTGTLKSTTTKIFQYSTPISTFEVLSKWCDPCISINLELFHDICRLPLKQECSIEEGILEAKTECYAKDKTVHSLHHKIISVFTDL